MDEINKFRKCLAFVLKWEGGYVNDPDDPGGETKWGISKRAYPDLDIKNLTPEQALEIYRQDYWEPMGCPSFDISTALVAFDTAVNLGVKRTKSLLDKSQKPLQDHTTEGVASELLRLRVEFYLSLVASKTSYRKYLKGWMNRVNDLKKELEILKKD